MIGVLFIPIIAIVLVDYYIIRRKHYDISAILDKENKIYWYTKGFNLHVYLSYVVGAIFAYYFTYVHPLATGATILAFYLQVFYTYRSPSFHSSPSLTQRESTKMLDRYLKRLNYLKYIESSCLKELLS